MSKEYNNFELLTALIRRDAARAYRIALYFASDERNHPIQMTLSTLFGFFSNLMAVYYIAQPNERSIASLLGVQPSSPATTIWHVEATRPHRPSPSSTRYASSTLTRRG